MPEIQNTVNLARDLGFENFEESNVVESLDFFGETLNNEVDGAAAKESCIERG